jgi:DNA-binding MarR family transcriptional regulator
VSEKISREDCVTVLTSVGGVIRAIKRMHSDAEGPDHGATVVLGTLFRCGPLRPSDLSKVSGFDLSTVSRYARIQEEAGRVAKVADPADRRAHRLALTEAGIDHIEGLYHARVEKLAGMIGHWTPAEARTFALLAGRLAADLGQQTPIVMPDLETVRATHQAALAETLPKGA